MFNKLGCEMNKLPYYRKLADMTQNELAGKAGVSQSLVSHIENGRRSPGEQKLNLLKAFINVLNDEGVKCTLVDVFPEDVVCGMAARKRTKKAA